MRVHIETLREFAEIGSLLRDDGWVVEQTRKDRLLARHPDASDDFSIRSRLLQLGLLTSSLLRIRLEPGDLNTPAPPGPHYLRRSSS